MIEIKGFFRPNAKMVAWGGKDRNGNDLNALYCQRTGEWSVATYGEGIETSVMNKPGAPVADNSEMFRKASATMRTMRN